MAVSHNIHSYGDLAQRLPRVSLIVPWVSTHSGYGSLW